MNHPETASLRTHSAPDIDALTGVGSRQRFDAQLANIWETSQTSNSPFSLLLFDIDFFSGFRERFGSEVSDECLRRIAEGARSVLRRSADALARYGNEEFAVILPGSSEMIATAVAERLRYAIISLELPNPVSTVGPVMTISIGVVTATPDRIYSSPAALLESAELMLYQAQISGHDRAWSISDYRSSRVMQSLAA